MDALKTAQQAGVVLGLKDAAGTVNRLDIDDLMLNKPNTFNLFLLALIELQDVKNTKDRMAFYQIAGIHGLPSVAWDGVTTSSGKGDGTGRLPTNFAGYCVHSQPSFPSWHRPYLAMLEQSLYLKMAEIAEKFPEASKDKYRKAVKEFRFPYWDYYRPRSSGNTVFNGITGGNGTSTSFGYNFMMPEVLTMPQVMVRIPDDDKLYSRPNPLRRFAFPTAQAGGFRAEDVTGAARLGVTAKDFTVRYPRFAGDGDGDINFMNSRLNNVRESSATRILDMVLDYPDYEVFATDVRNGPNSGSLEGLHGNYHVTIGGSGNQVGRVGWMSQVPTAAFDPVFWLHHCNIDRYAAIWQAVHPQEWFNTSYGIGLSKGPAVPFRRTTQDLWKINDARSTSLFGYTYADALGSPDDVAQNFDNLYSWASSRSQSDDPPDSMPPLPYRNAQAFQFTKSGSLPDSVGPAIRNLPQAAMKMASTVATAVTENVKVAATAVAPAADSGTVSKEEEKKEPVKAPLSTDPVAPGTNTHPVALTNMPKTATDAAPADVDESTYFRDWYIDNDVEKMAFNGPFTVYYFVGPFDDNEAAYDRQPTLAGFNHVFTSSRELCDNCGEQAHDHLVVSDTDAITPLLKDYVKVGQLADLSPANVVPFLVKNLKWRVVTLEGVKKDPRITPGFKIGISSKLSPLDRSTGDAPLYQEYPQVIEQIISNASAAAST